MPSFGRSSLINTMDDIVMNSDFVTNSYGESYDSSCENSWVPVNNQWIPLQSKDYLKKTKINMQL